MGHAGEIYHWRINAWKRKLLNLKISIWRLAAVRLFECYKYLKDAGLDPGHLSTKLELLLWIQFPSSLPFLLYTNTIPNTLGSGISEHVCRHMFLPPWPTYQPQAGGLSLLKNQLIVQMKITYFQAQMNTIMTGSHASQDSTSISQAIDPSRQIFITFT